MTVQTANYFEAIEHMPSGGTLLLKDVGWDEYEELIDSVGEAGYLRISYDAGRLQIMTLSPEHEHYQVLINDLVKMFCVKHRIKVLCYGSATMRKKPRGVEPDLSFYVQSADLLPDKLHIDFSVDPPPDLVVEVDLQHQSLFKFPIYASLGVSEIWRYDGDSMTVYWLERGAYVQKDNSRALPALPIRVLETFLARGPKEDQFETLLAFEDWLRTEDSQM